MGVWGGELCPRSHGRRHKGPKWERCSQRRSQRSLCSPRPGRSRRIAAAALIPTPQRDAALRSQCPLPGPTTRHLPLHSVPLKCPGAPSGTRTPTSPSSSVSPQCLNVPSRTRNPPSTPEFIHTCMPQVMGHLVTSSTCDDIPPPPPPHTRDNVPPHRPISDPWGTPWIPGDITDPWGHRGDITDLWGHHGPMGTSQSHRGAMDP